MVIMSAAASVRMTVGLLAAVRLCKELNSLAVWDVHWDREDACNALPYDVLPAAYDAKHHERKRECGQQWWTASSSEDRAQEAARKQWA